MRLLDKKLVRTSEFTGVFMKPKFIPVLLGAISPIACLTSATLISIVAQGFTSLTNTSKEFNFCTQTYSTTTWISAS
jgi:hypothetical protein